MPPGRCHLFVNWNREMSKALPPQRCMPCHQCRPQAFARCHVLTCWKRGRVRWMITVSVSYGSKECENMGPPYSHGSSHRRPARKSWRLHKGASKGMTSLCFSSIWHVAKCVSGQPVAIVLAQASINCNGWTSLFSMFNLIISLILFEIDIHPPEVSVISSFCFAGDSLVPPRPLESVQFKKLTQTPLCWSIISCCGHPSWNLSSVHRTFDRANWLQNPGEPMSQLVILYKLSTQSHRCYMRLFKHLYESINCQLNPPNPNELQLYKKKSGNRGQPLPFSTPSTISYKQGVQFSWNNFRFSFVAPCGLQEWPLLMNPQEWRSLSCSQKKQSITSTSQTFI